jgi:hypothetical protein
MHSAAAIEARFQLNGWRSTGVWPRGAQVRRTTGVSESPDSSQKTMIALRRAAPF